MFSSYLYLNFFSPFQYTVPRRRRPSAKHILMKAYQVSAFEPKLIALNKQKSKLKQSRIKVKHMVIISSFELIKQTTIDFKVIFFFWIFFNAKGEWFFSSPWKREYLNHVVQMEIQEMTTNSEKQQKLKHIYEYTKIKINIFF